VAMDPCEGGEVEDEPLVDGGLEVEVEGLERLQLVGDPGRVRSSSPCASRALPIARASRSPDFFTSTTRG
jgi:hypothetical protein